ncbi:MAG: CopG family transcriptional regulator [Nitrospirae bacterium]|nr:CopG family transcriptional regulator [Nitrospirota bacterium]
MERQNVTLSIDKSLLKKAKMLAASEDKSLSALIRESLEKRIRETTGFKKAQARQLKILKKGYDLGTKGKLPISRESLHER